MCDVCYDFQIKTILGSSLPPVVCKEGSYFIYVICACLRILAYFLFTYIGVLFVYVYWRTFCLRILAYFLFMYIGALFVYVYWRTFCLRILAYFLLCLFPSCFYVASFSRLSIFSLTFISDNISVDIKSKNMFDVNRITFL